MPPESHVRPIRYTRHKQLYSSTNTYGTNNHAQTRMEQTTAHKHVWNKQPHTNTYGTNNHTQTCMKQFTVHKQLHKNSCKQVQTQTTARKHVWNTSQFINNCIKTAANKCKQTQTTIHKKAYTTQNKYSQILNSMKKWNIHVFVPLVLCFPLVSNVCIRQQRPHTVKYKQRNKVHTWQTQRNTTKRFSSMSPTSKRRTCISFCLWSWGSPDLFACNLVYESLNLFERCGPIFR